MKARTLEIGNDLGTANFKENLEPETELLSASIKTNNELSEMMNHDFESNNELTTKTSSLIEEAFALDEEFSNIYGKEVDYTNPRNRELKTRDYTPNKEQPKKIKKSDKSRNIGNIEQYKFAA